MEAPAPLKALVTRKESPWRSYLVSCFFTAYGIVYAIFMFGSTFPNNPLSTFPGTIAWLESSWWRIVVALILSPAPIYRAIQSLHRIQSEKSDS